MIALPIVIGVGIILSIQARKPSFDPASYGLPEFIGDFRVLVVQTSDNTACLLPIEKWLTLQALNPEAKELLNYDPIPVVGIQSLKEQGWAIFYIGLDTTREERVREIEEMNERSRADGCAKSYGYALAMYADSITFSDHIPVP